MRRRRFLKRSIGLAAISASSLAPASAVAAGEVQRRAGSHIRIGLNAYSFNQPLSQGKMTLEEVVGFCAAHEVDGLDATGYYFPGYPDAPSNEYVYSLKRHAYVNGVTISGTGVRNDFAVTDPLRRKEHIQLVKNWIEVAQKLGAGFVRVFSGQKVAEGSTFDKTLEWIIPAFQECAAYGKQHGVVVGLQHHDDFLKTAEETIRVVEAVGSEWFSVILDVGSLRQGDPYEEMEKLLPYACSWQLKEQVWYGGKPVPIDLTRLRTMIEKTGYRGFLPVEALGPGEPTKVVADFLERVKAAFS